MAVSMVSAIRIDEFFDFSSARRWAHQRSASDSIAFLESPLILDEECQNPTATMMHHHGSTNNLDFGRLDDEQLMSMFFDDDDLRGSKGSRSAEECKRRRNRRRCRTMSGRWAGSAPRISSMIERRKRMMSGKIRSWRGWRIGSGDFPMSSTYIGVGVGF
ncbi:hypothetical protein ACFX1X_043852 [Malus domestica]